MIAFCLKRLALMIPVFFAIVTVSFAVTELAPGDPVEMQMQMNPKLTAESKEQMRRIYGLDKPLHVRYISWVTKMLRFDFGNSMRDGRPVMMKITERIPVTLLINLVSMAVILLLAIPIGIFCAVRAGKPIERIVDFVLTAGFAVPTFWLALLLMSLFGMVLHWLPVSGISSLDAEYMSPAQRAADLIRHLTLPILATSLTSLAGVAKYMRNSMIEILNQDYLKTARSFGLPEGAVLFRHAFRNALLPIITILGLSVPGLLGGSVIFETIFSIPGLGKLMYDSVLARDFPVYMSLLVIGATLTLIGNFLADVFYRLADPRIGWDK